MILEKRIKVYTWNIDCLLIANQYKLSVLGGFAVSQMGKKILSFAAGIGKGQVINRQLRENIILVEGKTI